MHLDFSLILFLLTVTTGVMWLLDRWLWEPARVEKAGSRQAAKEGSGLIAFGRSLFPVILAVFLLRSFVVEPFRIPSGSMMPTLLAGDFILVDKFSYGLRLPVLNREVVDLGEPKRGDVMVFRYPPDPSKDFIKRVIGLPGDVVTYYNKRLYINGKAVSLELLGPYTGPGADDLPPMQRLREDLMSVQHDILIAPGRPSRNIRYVVPEGHYFVMGDNRDNSDDSRRWGTVPQANLVGRAFLIWMNWSGEELRPLWGRIGTVIR